VEEEEEEEEYLNVDSSYDCFEHKDVCVQGLKTKDTKSSGVCVNVCVRAWVAGDFR